MAQASIRAVREAGVLLTEGVDYRVVRCCWGMGQVKVEPSEERDLVTGAMVTIAPDGWAALARHSRDTTKETRPCPTCGSHR